MKLKYHHNNCKNKLQQFKVKEEQNNFNLQYIDNNEQYINAENGQKATKTNLNSHTFSKCARWN